MLPKPSYPAEIHRLEGIEVFDFLGRYDATTIDRSLQEKILPKHEIPVRDRTVEREYPNHPPQTFHPLKFPSPSSKVFLALPRHLHALRSGDRAVGVREILETRKIWKVAMYLVRRRSTLWCEELRCPSWCRHRVQSKIAKETKFKQRIEKIAVRKTSIRVRSFVDSCIALLT